MMAHENPEAHACHLCGFTWKHGAHGGHSCAERLAARVAELEQKNKELARLAYIGEHRFPDLTWKARCEELALKLGGIAMDRERARADELESARLAELLQQAAEAERRRVR